MADGKLEAIYDEQISPLMQQIIAICKANSIPFHAGFALDGDLACTTHVPPATVDAEDAQGVHDWRATYNPAVRVRPDPPPPPLMLNVRNAQGQITHSEVMNQSDSSPEPALPTPPGQPWTCSCGSRVFRDFDRGEPGITPPIVRDVLTGRHHNCSEHEPAAAPSRTGATTPTLVDHMRTATQQLEAVLQLLHARGWRRSKEAKRFFLYSPPGDAGRETFELLVPRDAAAPDFDKAIGNCVEAIASFYSLPERITEYLSAGGLVNPELMEHDKVRDLLVECRDALAASPTGEAPTPANAKPERGPFVVATYHGPVGGNDDRGVEVLLRHNDTIEVRPEKGPVAKLSCFDAKALAYSLLDFAFYRTAGDVARRAIEADEAKWRGSVETTQPTPPDDTDDLLARLEELAEDDSGLLDGEVQTIREAAVALAEARAQVARLQQHVDDWRFVPDGHGGHMLSVPTGDKWYPEKRAP